MLMIYVLQIYKKKEVYTFLGQDFLKNYSLRDNLVSEDCQMSCFVLQIYKKVILLAQNYLIVYDLSTYFIKKFLYEKK